MKLKIQKLEAENEDLKGKLKVTAKKERSISENTKNQL